MHNLATPSSVLDTNFHILWMTLPIYIKQEASRPDGSAIYNHLYVCIELINPELEKLVAQAPEASRLNCWPKRILCASPHEFERWTKIRLSLCPFKHH